MLTPHLFLIALLLPLFGIAQNDYLITATKDTLHGKIRHNRNLLGNRFTVQTAEGKKEFHYRDIHEYQKKGRKYMRARHITPKGKLLTFHCRIMVDGPLRLLEETVMEGPAHFLFYQGEFIFLNNKYFPLEVWEQLIQCQPFAEKYAGNHSTKGGRLMVFPKQLRVWAEIVDYYNRQCH